MDQEIGKGSKLEALYIGNSFQNGFIIDYEIGIQLTKLYKVEQKTEGTRAFTIEICEGKVILFALGLEHLVCYIVELPNNMEHIEKEEDLEDDVTELEKINVHYKKIRNKVAISFYILMCLVCLSFFILMRTNII